MSPRWLGRLVRGVRAGERHALPNQAALRGAPETIIVKSEWFEDGQALPAKSAGIGLGDNISPPLSWRDLPPSTAQVAIIIEDLDAPTPRPVVHLLAFGLSSGRNSVSAGELRVGSAGMSFGRNSVGDQGYRGPRPLTGHGPHRYRTYVLALNQSLSFTSPPTLAAFLRESQGSVSAFGRLTGVHERR